MAKPIGPTGADALRDHLNTPASHEETKRYAESVRRMVAFVAAKRCPRCNQPMIAQEHVGKHLQVCECAAKPSPWRVWSQRAALVALTPLCVVALPMIGLSVAMGVAAVGYVGQLIEHGPRDVRGLVRACWKRAGEKR